MKLEFRYEGFTNIFIVGCSVIFKRLGNTALDCLQVGLERIKKKQGKLKPEIFLDF